MTEAELKKVWNIHYKGMLKYAETIVERTEIAEDIVQEAFISLWLKYNGGGGKEGPICFLRLGVKNKCRDYLRHLNSSIGRMQNIDDNFDEVLEDSDLIIINTHVVSLIYERSEMLPEVPRKVFHLLLYGLTFREVAAKLNMSPQTVLNQKTNAVNKLKAFVHNNKLI